MSNVTSNATYPLEATLLGGQHALFVISEVLYLGAGILTVVMLKRQTGVRGWTTPRLFCVLFLIGIVGTQQFGFLFLVLTTTRSVRMVNLGMDYGTDYQLYYDWEYIDLTLFGLLTNHLASYIIATADLLIAIVWYVRFPSVAVFVTCFSGLVRFSFRVRRTLRDFDGLSNISEKSSLASPELSSLRFLRWM